jgi:hypothetical protein
MPHEIENQRFELQRRIEANKLVGEWCKWLVTIETAAIAAIAAFSKVDDGRSLGASFKVPSALATLCFVASIAITSLIMISLPTNVQDITPDDSLWDRPVFGPRSFEKPLWWVTYVQMGLFVAGVAAFCVGAIMRLWT